MYNRLPSLFEKAEFTQTRKSEIHIIHNFITKIDKNEKHNY